MATNFELNVKINGVEQTITTIGGLETALAETNAELGKIDEGSREFKSLQNQASNLTKVIGALNNDTKKFDTTIKQTANDAKTLGQNFTQTAEAASKISNQAGGVKKVSDEIKNSSNSSQSLKAELRQVIQELQQLEPGSARFQQLSVRAGELRDTISDTNAVVTSLAGNTTERLGNALSGVANVGIVGLQGLTGAIGLFGGESEKVQEIFQKLQGLLLITQSISAFGGLADQITQIKAGFSSLTAARSADLAATEAQTAAVAGQTTTENLNTVVTEANVVATEAKVVATEADVVATTSATVATRSFTAALAANPLGLIAVALSAVVAGLVLFGGETEKTTETTDELIQKQKEQVEQSNNAAQALTQLAFETARLNALQIKDVDKRNAALDAANRDFIKAQEKDIVEYQRNQEGVFDSILKEANKFKNEFSLISLRAEYNELAGQGVQYVQVVTKLGQDEISSKRNQINQLEKLEKLRNQATANNTKNLTTAEKIALIERLTAQVEITTGTYQELLKAQLKYVNQASDIDKKKTKDDINSLLTKIANERTAILKSYNDQLKTLSEQREKEIEVEKQKADQAAEERKRKLEAAQQQYKQAYQQITQSISSALTEANNIEKKYLEDLERLGQKTKLDELEFEKKKEKERIAELVKSKTDEINKSVLGQKEKSQKINKINSEFNEALLALDGFYLQKRLNLINEEVAAELKKANDLRVINQVLQTETAFGDQNASDQRRLLKLQEIQFEIDDTKEQIKRAKETNFVERFLLLQTTGEKIKSFSDISNEREANLKKELDLLKEKETIETQTIENERVKRIVNFEEFIIKQFGFAELQRQKDFKAELDKINKLEISETEKIERIRQLNIDTLAAETTAEIRIANSTRQTELAQQKVLLDQKKINQTEYLEAIGKINLETDNKIQKLNSDGQARINAGALASANALSQASVNATEEAESKKSGIVRKYLKLKEDAEKLSEDELLEYKLKKADEAAKKIQQGFDLVFNFAQSLQQLRQTEDENSLIELKLYNENRQNELTASFNTEVELLKKRAEAGLITEQQYNDAILKLDKNRAASTEALATNLSKKELEIKKKAFETDKKNRIAQSIISGAQGALQAFLGPFSNPALVASGVAPIIGGILSALVATTTGIQVAAIQKTKFDSSGSIPQTAVADTGFASGGLSTGTTTGNQLGGLGGGFTSFTNSPVSSAGSTTPFSTSQSGQSGQRVYVLESDISNAQQRVRVLEGSATFG
jgi:hypothetical protein